MEANVERVIDEYSDMVYRIALTRTRIVENAEDIYQEVFLKYGEKSPKFKDSEHEKAWLIRVTINLTKNFYNSSWNKRVVTLDENLEFESSDETEVFLALCNLPQNYRTVIYLMYYEGYKVKEIAKIMKKKEGTIKTWAFRARKILEENLKGEWSDE
jgi:RNA polymerase sigma-70 factor (ECF subfamily)